MAAGWLAGWLAAGLLACRLAECLAGWLGWAGWTGWLLGWLLTDWLTGWLLSGWLSKEMELLSMDHSAIVLSHCFWTCAFRLGDANFFTV